MPEPLIRRIETLIARPKDAPQPLWDWYGVLVELCHGSVDLYHTELLVNYIFTTPSLKNNECIITCLQGFSLSQAKIWLARPNLANPVINALPQGLVRRYLKREFKYFKMAHPRVVSAILSRLTEPLEPNINYDQEFGLDYERGRNIEFYRLLKELDTSQMALVPKSVWQRLLPFMLTHTDKSRREEAIIWMGHMAATPSESP